MLLDTVQSGSKNETNNSMNDSETEFIAPQEIELPDNPHNMSVLIPRANVHVVDEGTTHS